MANVDACSRGLFRGRSESINSVRFFYGSESGSDVDEDDGLAGWSFVVVVVEAVVVAPSQVLLLLLLGTVDSGVLDFIR